MRPIQWLAAGILCATLAPSGAFADFRLQNSNAAVDGGTPALPPSPGIVASSTNSSSVSSSLVHTAPKAPVFSAPLPPPAALPRLPGAPIPLTPQASRVPFAHGFGHQIPLSFAVRQILPKTMHAKYANSIDESALVDWRGGQPWNIVLVHALAPLGYHAWISGMTVHIYE